MSTDSTKEAMPLSDDFIAETLTAISTYEGEFGRRFFLNGWNGDARLTFLVTEVGCGLAGYSVDQIAPLFKACMGLGNVVLPRGFVRVLSHGG